MRTEYLEYLLHIAKTKSINTSAKALYISQQSLSKAIKALENELGTALLVRHHYGVELTEAGRLVTERAKIISDQVYKIDQELFPFVDKQVSSLQGDLRIGITYHLMNAILYTIIGSFSKGNPWVKLHTDHLGLWEVLQALQEGAIDVGVMGFWFRALEDEEEAFYAAKDGLIYEELYRSEMMVCVNKESPLASHKTLSPQILQPYHLIEYVYQRITEKIFESIGGTKSLLETVSPEMFKQMIGDGLGYGFIDDLDWRENYTYLDKERMAAIPLAVENAYICYGLMYRPEQLDNAASQAFCQVVRERFNRIEQKLGK